MLKFSKNNEKLEALKAISKKKVYSFSLLSGWTCPHAKLCLSKVHEVNGKRFIKDGPQTEFRCFSASQEALYTNVYKSRKYNTEKVIETLRSGVDKLVNLIHVSLPKDAGIIRMHVAGDFLSKSYMLAWLEVIRNNPSIHFYAYTKSLPYWIEYKKEIDRLPNLILTASYGGRYDHLIEEHGLKSAKVVYSKYQARKLKLPIDTSDKYAALPRYKNKSFSLLIHGQMPKGSKLARRWAKRKTLDGYGKGKHVTTSVA